jgi:hypothetical protein
MGGMKDLREVTANIQNATMQNNMDAQKLADAKLINGPIVDQLKLMLAELRKESGLPAEVVASNDTQQIISNVGDISAYEARLMT